jgi:hypothetical protein
VRRSFLHLAWALLLLSSVSAVAASLPGGELGLKGQTIGILVNQGKEAASPAPHFHGAAAAATSSVLSVASRVQLRSVWTMIPSASQAAELHSVTGSAL